MNYYNEFDKNAVAWLRELIKLGAIPDGEVDERSIEDVRAEDLKGFVQCHFFAGIGGWSEALRRAGVPATRPLWTGSCPCQDFSCAGKGKGIGSHRDLWPEFFRLIRECRPNRLFGEQVETAVGHGWLDRLSADMEGEGYAVGSVVLGAHSAGADHQRQRLYWVADADQHRCHQGRGGVAASGDDGVVGNRAHGGMADAETGRLGADGSAQREARHPAQRDTVGGLENPPCVGRRGGRDGDSPEHGGTLQVEGSSGACGVSGRFSPLGITEGERSQGGTDDGGGLAQEGLRETAERRAGLSGVSRNFWSDAVAIPCRDGRYRRFEPGIFPLVAKLPRGVVPSSRVGLPIDANQTSEARVMRLKGYGNAICVDTAAMFIEACEGVLK